METKINVCYLSVDLICQPLERDSFIVQAQSILAPPNPPSPCCEQACKVAL